MTKFTNEIDEMEQWKLPFLSSDCLNLFKTSRKLRQLRKR